MATTDELLDALMRNCKKPQDLFGNNGLLNQLSGKSQEQVIPTRNDGTSGKCGFITEDKEIGGT